MKNKTIFALALFIVCIFNVQAQIYHDGDMSLERIGMIEGIAITWLLPAPPEVGGVLMGVYDPPNTHGSKLNLYYYKDNKLKVLCSDNNKEFKDLGQNLNSYMLPYKDGVYVSTMDPVRGGWIATAWKCGYDGTITRIIGIKDVVSVPSTRYGRKSVTFFDLRMPHPTNEEGVYDIIGDIKDSHLGITYESGMYKFNTKTQEVTEIFVIPSPYFQESGGNGFWTDGYSATFHLGQTGSSPLQLVRCSPPKSCIPLLLYNNVQGNNRPTYDIPLEDGFNTSYLEGDAIRLLHCNITCITYLKTEDLPGPEKLFPEPSPVPYGDPCTMAASSVGRNLFKMTAVLVCKGEDPKFFIHDGVFPWESVPSRYYLVNSEDRKGGYLFQACPDQELWFETCWNVWKASITPVQVPVSVIFPYSIKSEERRR